MVVPKLQHKYDFHVNRYKMNDADVMHNNRYPLSPQSRADISLLLVDLEQRNNATRESEKAVDALYYVTRTGSIAFLSGDLEVVRKDIIPKVIDKYFHDYDIQYVHRGTTDIKVHSNGVVQKVDFTVASTWEKLDYKSTVYIIDIDTFIFNWRELEVKAKNGDIVMVLNNKVEKSFIYDFSGISITCTQGDLYKHRWEVLRDRVQQAKEQSIELNQVEGVKVLSLLEGIMLMLDDEYK